MFLLEYLYDVERNEPTDIKIKYYENFFRIRIRIKK